MPRNLQELRERIRNEQNNLDQLRAQNRALADDPNATAAQIEAALENVSTLDARIRLMQDELQAEEGRRTANLQPAPADDRGGNLARMLASREYARAFATALRDGVSLRAGRNREDLRVLYDAMTEAGGSPAGSAGGFLVPEDIDVTIRETRRNLVSLADLFQVEAVSTNSGARTKDTSPTTGFTALASEIPYDATTGKPAIPMDDQPVFAQVAYSLTTYGLNIPISNELVADEAANLFGYLGRFFAKKQVITENNKLLSLLQALTPVTFTASAANGTGYDKLRQILVKSLDPDISANAAIITNQSGFDYLDAIKDSTGRPLIQPDPTTGTPMLLRSKKVVMMSDAMLPNVVTGSGASATTEFPFFIGDFNAFGTLFVRQPLEIATTDVGGDAWRTNSTEVRGILRLDARTFDAAAAVYAKMQ